MDTDVLLTVAVLEESAPPEILDLTDLIEGNLFDGCDLDETCPICGDRLGWTIDVLCPLCREQEEEDRRAWHDEFLQRRYPF